jgi:multiple sugar transport system substrate-binding protein
MSDKRIEGLIAEAKTLKYSRRQVMRRAVALGLSVPAVSAALATSGYAAPGSVRKFAKAPAQLEGTKLNILGASYFVVAGQDHYDAQIKEWGDANGVEMSVDYVAFPDLQAKIGAAIQAESGPDIVQLWDTWPYLYYQNLVDVNDLAMSVGDATGGFYEWVTNTASVDGKWYSIPYGTSSAAFAYRESYLEEAGATEFPKTWEEFFALGKKLKEMGKPIGQALGHSLGDPPSFTYPYMWAFGAMEVEEDGTTVAFNKPEFVEGMQMFIQGWKDGFDETGLSWDDSANNTAFLSDQISVTLNGSSIYIRAHLPEADGGNPAIADDINHGDFPEGPAGRFANIGAQSWGIMSHSDNVDGAKAFLEWWYGKDQLTSWYEANEGYYIPATPEYIDLEVYTADPKLAPYLNLATYGRNKGYAGLANDKAALAYSKYVVIDTFARAVAEGDAQGAIDWGTDQLERIYGG